MGLRGPKTAPTQLKLLRGERKDRVNHDEPPAPTGALVAPDDMTDDVRDVWDYCIENLDAMGLISRADRDALVCFCEAVVTHRKASALLARSPVLIQGHRGVLVRNPAIAMQRDAAMLIKAFAHEFGFTPSARSEIHRGATSDNSQPAARYLNGA